MERLYILRQATERKLTQAEAGRQLGLSARHVRRLIRRLKEQGPSSVPYKTQPGNRGFDMAVKEEVMQLVREKYCDFGPTFAAEKLKEIDKLSINRETLRQWMIEAGLWRGKKRKVLKVHHTRERRPRFGELVQIDGSHHDWFEGRAPKCCLIVFIDDATGKIIAARFEPTETTFGYMRCIRAHLEKYGKPLSYYSDRHSIFRNNRKDCVDGIITDTQLHRALRTLGIELICARSSQAKGRVERANQTMQDRLVKEMRLRGISSIEEGNAYLEEFIAKHNEKFAVPPQNSTDAHRPSFHDAAQLDAILSVQSERKLSKNLEFSHNCVLYKIVGEGRGYRLRHATVTVCELMNGEVEVYCGERKLQYTTMQGPRRAPVVDAKELNPYVDQLTEVDPHPR
ncbi:MAG: ISNCY family transposase [Holosporales bacterium]|jgi:transposase|nr:ISNCY family transposase [Holosporales bacterium]